MRLLNTFSHQLKEFFETEVPPYAIISHRWQEDEVSFKEFKKGHFEDGTGQLRSGAKKIFEACSVAQSRGLDWMWIDTCCIDKRSSAELSEAINSMYRWYQNSKECYVHLVDVRWNTSSDHHLSSCKKQFAQSQWFLRGWTLQELLAPRSVIFFDKTWVEIGNRGELCQSIADTTGIDVEWLLLNDSWQPPRSTPLACERKADCRLHSTFDKPSIATKMSWASKRETSRVEDIAYCLIGIFGVNMPLLYGEGIKAFLRLQWELIKADDDDSILCFQAKHRNRDGWTWPLAESPAAFSNSSHIQPCAYGNSPVPSPFDVLQVFRGCHSVADRGLELSVTWRSYDKDRSCLRLPLHCGQCGPNGPSNVVLRVQLGEFLFLEGLEKAFGDKTSLDTIKESDIFYWPLGDFKSCYKWQACRPMEIVEEWSEFPEEALAELKTVKLLFSNK